MPTTIGPLCFGQSFRGPKLLQSQFLGYISYQFNYSFSDIEEPIKPITKSPKKVTSPQKILSPTVSKIAPPKSPTKVVSPKKVQSPNVSKSASPKKPSSPSKLNKSNSENEKASKKKKDPNAPKQPLSSYMLFCKEERPKIKAANPDMKFSEYGTEMGKRWKEMDPLEKQKYTNLHEELRQKFNQDMAAVKETKVSKFKTAHFLKFSRCLREK